MESRKSHCYKCTSETDLKENNRLLPVQQKKGIQHSRKAADVRNGCRNTDSFPWGQEHWGLLKHRTAALLLKGVQHSH